MRVLCLLMTLTLTCAAQDMPPPPKAADEGSSLADTMKFIQDTLGEQGKVNYIMHLQDGKGRDKTYSHTDEVSNVMASAPACTVDYHWRSNIYGENRLIPLKDVRNIAVMPPSMQWRTDPPLFGLFVNGPNNGGSFEFFDGALANRVAKAFAHAVELCGGETYEQAFAMQSGTAPSTPMPAKPAAEGASLVDTMKFIQDKLNESGQVHFAASIADGTGADPANLSIVEAWANVAAIAAACRISYHTSLAENGGAAVGEDATLAAWEIEKIEVLPMDQFFALAAAKAGRPQWTVQVQPPVSVLRTQLHGGGFAAFAFYDADLADRMAKAMVHAVELCGGGNKEPF